MTALLEKNYHQVQKQWHKNTQKTIQFRGLQINNISALK